MVTRALVVDDDPAVLMTVAANLELEGFDIATANGAEEALALLAKQDFDVILSDVRMPGLSGVELYERVRKIRPDTPFVLMTAYANEAALKSAVRAGVFSVLAKPLDVDQATRILERAKKRPAVLVVDDAEPHARSLAAALEASGVKATAVYDGPSALTAIRDGGVDVCVVDLVMPGMDGAAVLAEVRKLRPDVPVIAFSGKTVAELMARVASGGAVGCFETPIAVEQLVDAISRARVAATRSH
jgi:DNA-binding NtrC family response regulator